MDAALPKVSVAEQLAERIVALKTVPAAVRVKCEDLAVDVAGLCVTARNEEYVQAALAGCDDDGVWSAMPGTPVNIGRALSIGRQKSFPSPKFLCAGQTTLKQIRS